jgi:hypothetical protein
MTKEERMTYEVRSSAVVEIRVRGVMNGFEVITY